MEPRYAGWQTALCPLVLFCHFIKVWSLKFSLCLLMPVLFSSVALLLQAFAFCTVVCLPVPLFFIFYQCHFSLLLMSCLWNTPPLLLVSDSVQLRSLLSCLFQGICIASPPVCICCFSLIMAFIYPFLVFLSLCLLLSSYTFVSAFHFLFFFSHFFLPPINILAYYFPLIFPPYCLWFVF